MTSIRNHLTHLETVGLIKLVQAHPELEYLFRHNLVQEVAYNSLLIEDRKKLHRRVGEAIEQTYPDRLEEFAAVLGNHFEIAGDDQKALKYFTLAGDTDFAIYANAEAVAHYTRALKIIPTCEVSGEDLTHLYTNLGRGLELSSQYDRALVTYEEMGEVAQQRSDPALELASLLARVTLLTMPTAIRNNDQAHTLAQQALNLAQDTDDRATEAKLLWTLLRLHIFTDKVPKAIEYGERSLALARQLNLRQQMALTLTDLASQCYYLIGRLDQAKAALHEARDIWRELDNLPMFANSLSTLCATSIYAGEFESALALSEEAYQISQSIGNPWGQSHSRYKIGHAVWELGQPAQAIAMMEDSLHLSEVSGFIFPQVITRVDLALLYGELGAIERGMETVRMALAVAETKVPFVHGHAMATLAYLHLLNDNLTEAKAALDQSKESLALKGYPVFFMPVPITDSKLALKQDDYERAVTVTDVVLTDLRQFNMRLYIPTVLYIQAQALLGQGQAEAARERLLEARAEAETIGSRRMLWQILLALSKVETDPAEADNLRQQARETVEYIANHIDQDDLRQSFLNLPDVQAALDK